jgi:hypothetical protein
MKSISHLALALVLCTTLTVCCQSQPHQTQPQTTGTIDSTGQTGEVLRNLIQDSVAISSLTDDDRAMLQRVYGNNRAVVSYRVIKDPFPRADSLAAFLKLRCNMSSTRVFTAERTSFDFDDKDIVWKGKLTGTGFVSDRPDYNNISLWLKPDASVQGGFRFTLSFVRVSNKEMYVFDTFDRYPSYFILVQYNPSAGLVITDSQPPGATSVTR